MFAAADLVRPAVVCLMSAALADVSVEGAVVAEGSLVAGGLVIDVEAGQPTAAVAPAALGHGDGPARTPAHAVIGAEIQETEAASGFLVAVVADT